MVEITPQTPTTQLEILPSKISHSPLLEKDILPIYLDVIWKTLLGT